MYSSSRNRVVVVVVAAAAVAVLGSTSSGRGGQEEEEMEAGAREVEDFVIYIAEMRRGVWMRDITKPDW